MANTPIKMNAFGPPAKLLSDEYLNKFYKEIVGDMTIKGLGISKLVMQPGPLRGKRADTIIIDDWLPNHSGRTVIAADDALNLGYDVSKLVRVSPDSEFYYKPPKEYPVAKVPRAKQVKEVQYRTVGVRFLDGPNLAKVYTYRVPKSAKLHLGQEVVVPTDKNGTGYITSSVAVVVELHTEKQDNFGYDYKFIRGTIKPL